MAQTQAAPRRAALLSLPTEMLCKIASHVVAPELVVAAGRDVLARTALRKGTDAAERARFGGIGLTVREAEESYGRGIGICWVTSTWTLANRSGRGSTRGTLCLIAGAGGTTRMPLQRSNGLASLRSSFGPSLHTVRIPWKQLI